MLSENEITALWMTHKGRVTQFARAVEQKTRAASAAPADEIERLREANRLLHEQLDTARNTIGQLRAGSAAPADRRQAVDERAAFEEWFESQWPLTFKQIKDSTAPDDTKEDYATAYDGWMARAALATAPTETDERAVRYLCTPKTGGEGAVIDRAPDSFELRECNIVPLKYDRDSVIALIENAIAATRHGADIYMASMIAADHIAALVTPPTMSDAERDARRWQVAVEQHIVPKYIDDAPIEEYIDAEIERIDRANAEGGNPHAPHRGCYRCDDEALPRRNQGHSGPIFRSRTSSTCAAYS